MNNVTFFRIVFVPILVCILIIFIGLLTIGVKKFKSRSLPESTLVVPFNTSPANENIIKLHETIFISIGIASITFPTFLLAQLGYLEKRDMIMFFFFVAYHSLVILLPLIYFVKRPSKFKTSLEVLRII